MYSHAIFAAFAALVSLTVAAPTSEHEGGNFTDQINPSGHEITIHGFTHGGSGCPGGSVSHAISDDGTILTLLYDGFIAEAGEDVPRSHGRRFCQLNFDLEYPHGFQFSIMENEFRGYVELPEGATAEQKAVYYFSGHSNEGKKEYTAIETWDTPQEDDYYFSHKIGVGSGVWSPCGKKSLMNIKSTAKVRIPRGSDEYAALTVDSTDHSFKQLYKFQWRECVE